MDKNWENACVRVCEEDASGALRMVMRAGISDIWLRVDRDHEDRWWKKKQRVKEVRNLEKVECQMKRVFVSSLKERK